MGDRGRTFGLFPNRCSHDYRRDSRNLGYLDHLYLALNWILPNSTLL